MSWDSVVLTPESVPWLTEVHEDHGPVQHRITADSIEAVNFIYHCDCHECELCKWERAQRATPTSDLRQAAEALGTVRQERAAAFAAYVYMHDGNTYKANMAVEEDFALRLVKAEAEYEIAKAELHG